MAEVTQPAPRRGGFLRRIDRAWGLFAAILLGLAILAPAEFVPSILSMLDNLSSTAIFIAIAVLMIAYLRASGAEAIVGKAFQGRESRMVVLAALVGGLAPFCSCEVIPFVAALLAMGTPLSAVMAFWLSSPIMDPAMFVITSGALGVDFAIGKTVAAVGFGLFGGFTVMMLSGTMLFADPLRETSVTSCGCGSNDPFRGQAVWAFWRDGARIKAFRDTALQNALFDGARIKAFRDTALQNALFLLKWLALAYLAEAVMVRFVPAEWIATTLGGDGLRPIFLGALVGGPTYLLPERLCRRAFGAGAGRTRDEPGGRDGLHDGGIRVLYSGGDRRLGAGQAARLRSLCRIRIYRVVSGRSGLGGSFGRLGQQLYPAKFTSRVAPRSSAMDRTMAPVGQLRAMRPSGPCERCRRRIVLLILLLRKVRIAS
jgi:uncharacterized membrane protein YraQ (UPF0718 family)